MEAVGVVARLANLNAHDIVDAISDLVEPAFPRDHALAISVLRRFLITWAFLYVGSLVLYFAFASADYFVVFVVFSRRVLPDNYKSTLNVAREIRMSVWSLAIMAGLSTPAEVAIQLGYGKVYYSAREYGLLYLFLSPLAFLAFSDAIIYFIHRGLHHRLIYKHIHKAHHSFINTSPFAAFAFHPLDGFAQGVAYQIFVFLFPFHSAVHLISLALVSMWTINIHDRVSLGIPGVNGAAHHTIHHTTFRSNYGQYFTLWDRVCGTFRDPDVWKKEGAIGLTEKEAYGKDA